MDGTRARALLGVHAHATTDEIRRAFRRAVRRVHPDVGGDAAYCRSLVTARAVLLASTPARRRPGRWDVTVREPNLDLTDVARRSPALARSTRANTDFDAVLASVLAA